jgi:thiamine transport system ATP-binding protein
VVTGLAIRDAVVRYGPTVAVDGVSLDVAPGEVVALLGPSGSGKSSLLRAVAGLEPLAAGTVSWDGVDLTTVPVHRRGFAMMFQDGQLFPHLSVAGNVGYALAGRERVERDRRVGELLELVGLSGYGPRPVTALSGGQAQRVALARSLAASPRLLMLDEPLSALDTGLREHLLGVLDTTLQATGTPALYVTHDQDEAFAIADRVAVLSAGRLLQVDDPATLWRTPVDAEVASFLGYRLTLDGPHAASLGWPGTPAGLVAVGPDGLVADPRGTEVPVLGIRPRRGGTEFSVTVPGGGLGRVRTRELLTHADRRTHLAVRLDPAGCVVLPTGFALDPVRNAPVVPERDDARANPVAR